MAKYQHKEGRGKLFNNNKAMTDNQPVIVGSGLFKGEEVNLALWHSNKPGHVYDFAISAKEATNDNRKADNVVPIKIKNEPNSY